MVTQNSNDYGLVSDRIARELGFSGTKEHIDMVLRSSTGNGAMSDSYLNMLTGINHRQVGILAAPHREQYGLTFFTRPDMNLTQMNLTQGGRYGAALLSTDPWSAGPFIRHTLDPSLHGLTGESTPLVDPLQAFIPLLTNAFVNMSGFDELRPPTYTAPEGLMKESFSIIDGVAPFHGTYTLNCNMFNPQGSLLSALLFYWTLLPQFVFKGTMTRYRRNWIEDAADYQTRIYRIVLDNYRSKVVAIAACNAAFPTSHPTNNAFNAETSQPYNTSDEQITVVFQAQGYYPYDPILVLDFNDVVQMFNPGMRDDAREMNYMKVPPFMLNTCNFMGYPRIDPATYDFEWWVGVDKYKELLDKYVQINGRFEGK